MSAARARHAITAALLALLLVPAAAMAAKPFSLGFFDGVFTGSDEATWLGRAASAGSDVVRINIGWDAPNTARKPAGFNARNPADPNYDFTAADAAIRAASSDGLRVIVSFTGAPPWAEGMRMPAAASPGSWRPSPAALEDYAIALGRRYSGKFPDPLHPGRMLPRVYAFQPWNEPNLDKYLTPQWSGNKPEAPVLYRAMLNAFYKGLKSVDPGALVVTAGTAPFGDPEPGGERIMPALFWRTLLCENESGTGRLTAAHCPDPAHFDAMAHHPYSVGPPQTRALNADDVSIPDLGKLTRLLRFAERTGTALPHIHHQLWVTEVGYNTNPPNPGGVPVLRQAHWLDETLELLWHQGVDLVTWNTIVDEPPIPNYSSTSQSGVYYLNGRAKPSLQAFEFPLVVLRGRGSRVEVWGRSPASGRLKLQRRRGSSWITFNSLHVSFHSVFTRAVLVPAGTRIRGVIGAATSLIWAAP